jgi:hypothetical protein
MWFNLAAAAGNDEAAKNRDAIEKLMTTEQIAEAQRRMPKHLLSVLVVSRHDCPLVCEARAPTYSNN